MQITVKKVFKYAIKTFYVFMALLVLFLVYFFLAIKIDVPQINDRSSLETERKNPAPDFYTLGNNWLKKSNSGLWEMYIEGDGFERGVAIGKLTQELAERQETVFIDQIKKIVPSEGYLSFLKYFVAYFNRKLPEHITEEYQQEIYGVSLFASDKYDALAPKYYRILNYHAAHDIGHALQDKNMTVGCTSFATWGENSEDGKLIVGRNFDFYSGDEFAKNKIICFCKPTTGYKFTYITWAGFTGVVSGINDQGLTVTINSSKSEIPTAAATPISLLVKEILQYAKNIDEAMAIANKRCTFVSESIFIASKNDKQTFIIEKTPSKTNLYSEKRKTLVCSNHFQSELFKNDYVNNMNIIESSSMYRKIRMEELINEKPKMNYSGAAEILRNQLGINDKKIGFTNEKGINQLIAHHSVIFKPEDELMWLSTEPFQLGKFMCYDLKKVFAMEPSSITKREITEKEKTIPEDPILQADAFIDFEFFQKMKHFIQAFTKSENDLRVSERTLQRFVNSNPECYNTFWILGNYYKKRGNTSEAVKNYALALTKEVATQKEAFTIKELMVECLKNDR